MGFLSLMDNRIASPSFWMAGVVLVGLAATMVPCLIVSIIYGESLAPFLIPFILYAVLGGVFLLVFDMGFVRPSNVLVMLAVIWATSIGLGMIPEPGELKLELGSFIPHENYHERAVSGFLPSLFMKTEGLFIERDGAFEVLHIEIDVHGFELHRNDPPFK